jgi:hypothetical protein
MGKRKAAKAPRSNRRRLAPQAETAQKLRHLSKAEARDAYEAAKKAKKIHGPMHLLDAWWRWRHSHTLSGFVAGLRDSIKDRALDDPSLVAGHLARFIELMVVRFERLVEVGQFDSALPRLTGLPMLYSPRAGKGAPQWKKAKTLYQQKKVGTQALLEYRGRDPQTARNPVWGELAEIAVRVLHQAAVEYPILNSLKNRAVAFRVFENRRPRAKKTVRLTFYLLSDKGALIWPSWLEGCQGLPDRVSDNSDRYKRVAKPVLDEFFADPGNPFANDVIEALLESPSGYSRTDAVKQAIKNVLACIERL